MAVTIRDIAKKLGTSHSTVSRALRNDPRISAAMRAKVQEVARELGYRANAVARGLVSRRLRSVALIIPDVVDPFYARIVQGVDVVTHKHGYSLVLYITHSDPQRELAAVEAAGEHRYDGAILFRRHVPTERLRHLVEVGTPLVLMTRSEPGLPVDAVRVDDVDGGFQATAHLLEAGHQRVGFLGGPEAESETRERLTGYRRALAAFGLPYREEWHWHGDFTEKSGQRVAAAIAALPPDQRPTAVFAANDRMAIGLLAACRERGLLVPDELAIVGYDDIEPSQYVVPPLSTVRQPTLEMGMEAARLMIERLEGSTAPPREVLLKTEVIVRGSSVVPGGTRVVAGP